MAETSFSSSSSGSSTSSGAGPVNLPSCASDACPESSGPQQRDLQTDPKQIKEMLADLSSQFRNFDDARTYRELVDEALSQNTANFAVRFGVEDSEIATNLTCDNMRMLLQTSADKKNENVVTWINIWSPTKNREIVEAIADKYKFSARLGVTILGWDEARWQVIEKLRQPKNSTPVMLRTGEHGRLRARRTFSPRKTDLEAVIPRPVAEMRAAAARAGKKVPELHEEDLHMYKLLQEQYNYTTIDHGSNFVCIGANWLHERPNLKKESQGNSETAAREDVEETELVPPKHWAWYILTSDGTVISIHETPNFEIPSRKDVNPLAWQAEELKNMRKNTYDLLSQLSIPGMERYQYRTMSQKGVRSDLSLRKQRGYNGAFPSARTTVAESSIIVDASANLFFYLFEDYAAATKILSQSNIMLAQLTDEVLHITDKRNKDRDTSDIIKKLYARSKDLRQLKHLFESYEKLIKGIMELGTDTNSDDKDMAAMSSSTGNLVASGAVRGVKLSQRAFDRFDRLNVRLRLLMLDTIDEYLEEKSSLSGTYFNLLAQKDSQSTSKLNRSASLLAKLSVFFLPISFMTSYFSVQVPDLTDGFTGQTYWITFAVIATLSFLSLFFFSRFFLVVSDVLEEKVHAMQSAAVKKVYRSVTGKKKKEKDVDDGDDETKGEEGGGGMEKGG